MRVRATRSALLAVALAGCAPQMAATSDTPVHYPDQQVMPVDPVGIRPIPAIPIALRGCWQTDAPLDPEEPGAAHRLIVTATSIEQQYPGKPPILATAEFVERVTARLIEGRFTAVDSSGPMTVATSLSLLDSSTLRRQEGDAGSEHYYRCGAEG